MTTSGVRRFVLMTPNGELANHGGSGSLYANYGCRCDECVAANTRRIGRRQRSRRPEDAPKNSHGKASTFSNWNCRCDDCTAAYALKNHDYYYGERKAGR